MTYISPFWSIAIPGPRVGVPMLVSVDQESVLGSYALAVEFGSPPE